LANRGLALVVVALFALVVGLSLARARMELGPAAASAPPGTQGAAGSTGMPAGISREQAIALVRSSRDIGRVDRVEAKLMSFEEYVQLAGRVQTHPGDPQASAVAGFGITGDPAKRYVWVVAVSGEVWPNGRTPVYFGGPPPVPNPTPYPPYRWAMFLIDAVPGQLMTIGDAGIGASWPAIFDRLPDHPAVASGPASPSPLASPLQVQILGPEAMSAVLRLSAEVHRVDRIELKLVTRGEFERAQPSGAATFDENAPVSGRRGRRRDLTAIRARRHLHLGEPPGGCEHRVDPRGDRGAGTPGRRTSTPCQTTGRSNARLLSDGVARALNT